MAKQKAVAVSVGRNEMLALEFLRRAVEIKERTPVQIIEFSATPRERRKGKMFKDDPLYIDIKAKFLLQYCNPGDRVPFRDSAVGKEEQMHDFIYDIEASVPLDMTSGPPHLIPKKWCQMQVKKSSGCMRVSFSDRAPEETWTIMVKNRSEDGFFAESSDFCININHRYRRTSFNWIVGNSYTGKVEVQSHYDARNA